MNPNYDLGRKPVFAAHGGGEGQYGLDYREWLVGMIASGEAACPSDPRNSQPWTIEDSAEYSIRLADEIIRQMNKEKTNDI